MIRTASTNFRSMPRSTFLMVLVWGWFLIANWSSAQTTTGLVQPARSQPDRGLATPASHNDSRRSLPNDQGQVWQEYDLSVYTAQVDPAAKPEQALVDWILRETGTEAWFSEPFGLLSANRERLLVYHTPAMHAVVADIVERFVRTGRESHVFGVRLMTLANPNWRTKAYSKLQSVSVQSPGVEAWLLSKEDAAILVSDLSKRTACREYNSPNLMIYNGQSHDIERIRPVAYIRMAAGQPLGQPGDRANAQSEMGNVEEGFRLRLSPLLSLDGRTVDAVVKIETTQVEKMSSLWVNTPTVSEPRRTAQIQVPQTSSWSLHERFRWPTDRVLLISCGLVATPGPERRGILPTPVLPTQPPRADTLLLIDAKGRTNSTLAKTEPELRAGGLNYRGRY